MVDALDSKSNIRKSVKVQVLSPVFKDIRITQFSHSEFGNRVQKQETGICVANILG